MKENISLLQDLSSESLLAVNGGIAPEIIVALITIGAGAVKVLYDESKENAAQRGKNDAYNDMLGGPIYYL